MITINLIPVHMRKRKGSRFFPDGAALPKEVFVGIAGGFVAMLFAVIVMLQVLIIMKSIQYKNYEMRMSVLGQDKANVDRVINELRVQQAKLKSIDEIAGNSRVYLSQKLNDISNNLPSGVWLSRLTVEEKFIRIEGTAVSKNRSKMTGVHNFNANLQNSEVMKRYYKSVELELIKSRDISQTPVEDFAILAQSRDD